jgi:hypothetical protein
MFYKGHVGLFHKFYRSFKGKFNGNEELRNSY